MAGSAPRRAGDVPISSGKGTSTWFSRTAARYNTDGMAFWHRRAPHRCPNQAHSFLDVRSAAALGDTWTALIGHRLDPTRPLAGSVYG